MVNKVPSPDLVIYSKARPETLRERIGRKDMPAEHHISGAYLEEVVTAYEHFFQQYKASDLLVETSEMDFVHRN